MFRYVTVLLLASASGCTGEVSTHRGDGGAVPDASAVDARTTEMGAATDAGIARDAGPPPPVDAGPPPPVDAGPVSNASTYCTGGACLHWWNCAITYQYQYTTSRDWDTDIHMPDGTPMALPHASRLTRITTAGSGFQPEFTDLVTGEWEHFNHMHLNSEFGGSDTALGPVQLVSLSDPDHTDHIYPEGWVIGFSGGGTTRTGYLGTDSAGNVCTGGHSTAAHFCVVTHVAHSIDFYLPHDGAGCPSPLTGWPSALWSSISAGAPGYQTCPSICTRCGVAHF